MHVRIFASVEVFNKALLTYLLTYLLTHHEPLYMHLVMTVGTVSRRRFWHATLRLCSALRPHHHGSNCK